MNRNAIIEDVSFLLFFVPLIATGVYAIILWVGQGVSAILPVSVFLNVTRNPTLFLFGSFSVMLGTILEVSSEQGEKRAETVISVSRRLQRLAEASLILAILMSWYANSFTFDLGAVGADLLIGRFNLVFPALLFLLSFLIATPISLAKILRPKSIAIIALLLVPVFLFAVGKRNPDIGLAIAFLLLIFGGVVLSKY